MGVGGVKTSHCVTGYDTGHKVVAVYDSPAGIKEAGLSEVTLELSAIDTADIMSRLVTGCVSIPCISSLWISLHENFSDDQVGTGTVTVRTC